MIPPYAPAPGRFATQGGLQVERQVAALLDGPDAIADLARRLDDRRGLVMVCDVTMPNRYRPRAVGFADPPLVVTARGRHMTVEALNARGEVLLPALAGLGLAALSPTRLAGTVADSGEPADEAARTRRASAFTLVRALRDLIATADDHHFGLYGSFGYDLGLQIDPIRLRRARAADQRDMVLYLPDQFLLADPEGGPAHVVSYDFTFDGRSTAGLPRDTAPAPLRRGNGHGGGDDHAPGAYAQVVRQALEYFRRGDLFEAVPSQTFARPCAQSPSAVFA
ncbi:MAG TPA: anthranilate synthase component I, partial [Magnetospirillum sp.]|nr:anthranilate synthase component I [Magnetospirillum sp.]